MSSVIPSKTKLAANRAFVRTAAQTFKGAIPAGGVSAGVLASAIENPNPVQLAAAGVAWLTVAPLAGLVAYLDVLSKGIPQEYVDAGEQRLE
jgi:hypothetical protein